MLGYLNDVRPGRTWRDLQDTATSVQILDVYSQNSAYDNWRRDTDYYDEGELLWLEVDLTIRAQTADKKSLNDFAAAFFGAGGDTGPKVLPYTFDDLVAALNAVAPRDWATFLRKRLDANTAHVPELEGIDALSGYKLVYTSKPDYWTQLTEGQTGAVDTLFSLGMYIGADGRIADVVIGGVADKAGFGPGMRIVAVNGRGFGPLYLRQALEDSAGKGPAMEFIVENTGYYKVIDVDYHGGEKYPSLQKSTGVPLRLDEIANSLTR
jgi:predicted metalloprotease with PDZ domain